MSVIVRLCKDDGDTTDVEAEEVTELACSLACSNLSNGSHGDEDASIDKRKAMGKTAQQSVELARERFKRKRSDPFGWHAMKSKYGQPAQWAGVHQTTKYGPESGDTSEPKKIARQVPSTGLTSQTPNDLCTSTHVGAHGYANN